MLLGRRPVEPDDDQLRAFHVLLIEAAHTVRVGTWALCEATGWSDNPTSTQLLTWSWRTANGARSSSSTTATEAPPHACHLPWDDVAEHTWRLDDRLSGASYQRHGGDIEADGLFIGLAPWASHLFVWTPIVEAGEIPKGA